MASLKQIEANRRNALKSTGPKTEAGKNAARFNAIRHGCTAKLFLVDHEDEDEFNAFRDDFFNEHAPTTPTETFLVEQMVAAAWRIRRVRVTEAALWNLKMAKTDERLDDEFDDPPQAQYLAHALDGRFGSNSTANNLARYESRLERSFYKALHELERIRRERLPQQIGFVSHQPEITPIRPRYTKSSCSESVLPPPLPVTCTSVAREPLSSTGSSPAEMAER